MDTAKKRRLYNGLMGGAIILVIIGTVLGVGAFQGWFDPASSTQDDQGGSQDHEAVEYDKVIVTAQNKVGNVNIERGGIAYRLDDGDELRDGDIVEVLPASSVDICYGEVADTLTAGQEVVIHISDDHKVSLEYLNQGETDENGAAEAGAAGAAAAGGGAANARETKTVEPSATDPTKNPTCTITIQCTTILDNRGALKEGKSAYVPANGIILATSKVAFNERDSVFDVLKRVCNTAGIQLEYSWTPAYDSYYVEGINNLYEFDCGNESGWMYQVNDWYPDHGCSSYQVKDGDAIQWNYTCNGLGADLGAPMR